MQIKEKEKRKMDVILKDGSLGEQGFEDRDGARTFRHTTSHILAPVSYTHLTLPTT